VVRYQPLQALSGSSNQLSDFLAISESHKGGHGADAHRTGHRIEVIHIHLQAKRMPGHQQECSMRNSTQNLEKRTRYAHPLSCSQQLTLIKIASGLLSASSAKNGPIFTQGPHHVAKKSTNTVLSGVAMTASNKNDLPFRKLERNVAASDNNAELGIVTTTFNA
jgi:hypothetical protein